MNLRTLIPFTLLFLRTAQAQPAVEFLSALPERVAHSTQSWGELGLDVAAHAPGQPGLPLRLGTNSYPKGLGHHANGSITIMLDCEYAFLEAEIGIQTQASTEGSVVFRVLLDGAEKFKSGVIRQRDGAKSIRIPVAGANELVLQADDAGDGITCDMANWANARLTRLAPAQVRAAEPPVDMARFARVVTWDPNRMDGCRSDRLQEFRAEDLFLETELLPDARGVYTVPASTNGLGCIGLQWLNRRALRELSLQFADPTRMPAATKVQVQGWFGESAWQGGWKTLSGTNLLLEDRLVFRPAPKGNGDGWLQLQKVRWILPPAGQPFKLKGFSAFTRSRWGTLRITAQADGFPKGARARIRAINGEILTPPPGTAGWDLSRPTTLEARYSFPSTFKSDPTVLQFELPSGTAAVAVGDLFTHECVYLPEHALLVARESARVSMRDYKKKVASRKTLLQQVRDRPDQTLEQAMAKTHHDAQREGPVMLSLSCDNTKFVVERTGAIRFPVTLPTSDDWFASAGEITPGFGSERGGNLVRALDGGWLPIPVITVERDGLVFTQTTLVAPCDEDGAQPTRLNRRSICLAEFTVRNSQPTPRPASFTLSFQAEPKARQPLELVAVARGFAASREGRSLALLETNGGALFQPQLLGGKVTFTATLPPGASGRWLLCLPGTGLQFDEMPSVASWPTARAAVETYWRAVLAEAMTVEVPDPLVNELIRSSQVRCLIAARNEAGGARIAPWIAAMSYGPLESEAHSVLRGMDLMGHSEFARRGLDFFVHRYNREGFLTTGYTTFGTAWHLWTLGEHYQFNHDADWFQRVAPEAARAGDWIVRQTAKTRRLNADGKMVPEHGLMPPAVLADWNAFACYYCLNGYYYAALHQLGTALNEIGAPKGAFFLEKAAELRRDLLRAYHWTQGQSPALPLRNGAWVAAYPSQVHSPGPLADFFPGQDAGRSWCYDVELGAHQLVPTGVLDATSPEASRMLDHMEETHFLADGWFDYPAEANQGDWFNLGGFSKVQPYYTRNAEIYALRDEVKPFVRSYFNTLAAMLNPEVMTFWEHFHHSGAWDKTHETGYFLQQTRFMLVMERGDDLWLAPLITSNWLKNGANIAVSNAPTRFGKVSYRIASHLSQGFIEASIQPPLLSSPRELVLRVRHPEGKRWRKVTLNGAPARAADPQRECVRIARPSGPIALRVDY